MKNDMPLSKDPILGDILDKVKESRKSLNTIDLIFPSSGLLEYPELISNVKVFKSITLKPFTGKDIDEILQKLTNTSAIQYLNNLFDVLNIFVENLNPGINFDIRDLLPQDYYFLLLGFRNLNTSPVITKEFTCPHACDYSGKIDINLSDIDILSVSDFKPDNELLKDKELPDLFEIELPVSKLKVSLHYYPARRLLSEKVNYTDLIVYGINKVDGKKLGIPDIKILVNSLSFKDLNEIKTRMDLISNWGVQAYKFNCPKCGKPIYYSVPGDLDFVFPFLQ